MSRKAKAAKRAAEAGPARRGWTPAELRALFAVRPEDPALFWAPRIAVGTGMRMEEVLSLRGEDFRQPPEVLPRNAARRLRHRVVVKELGELVLLAEDVRLQREHRRRQGCGGAGCVEVARPGGGPRQHGPLLIS
jgi:integrase